MPNLSKLNYELAQKLFELCFIFSIQKPTARERDGLGEVLAVRVPLHFADAVHRLRSGRARRPDRLVDLLLVDGQRGRLLRHVHRPGHLVHTVAGRPQENLQGKSLLLLFYDLRNILSYQRKKVFVL